MELGTSHQECLYSQALVLHEAGWTVSVICGADLVPRIRGIEPLVDRIEPLEADEGFAGRWRRLRRTRRLVREADPDVVVFNTAQGSAVRDYTLLPRPSRACRLGILHHVDKLTDSFTQRLITPRMDGYFVLADHLLEAAPAEPPVPLGAFYPIFFPELAGPAGEGAVSDAGDARMPPAGCGGELWVTVPGSVEFRRRDYPFLWTLGPTLAANPRVRIVLLGRSDPAGSEGAELRRRLATAGIADRVELFDGFVEPAVFQAWLRRSDVILPLLHHHRPEFAFYAGRRTTGAFNLAAGWKIPLLCDRWFQRYEDYRENALFYDPRRPETALAGLSGRLSAYGRAFTSSKWTLEEQRARYVGLLARARGAPA